MTLDDLRKQAYDKAEAYYMTFHTENHERIRPFADYDEGFVVFWGRVWLLSLCMGEYMNNTMDPGGPTFRELIDDATTADHERVLEGMYG